MKLCYSVKITIYSMCCMIHVSACMIEGHAGLNVFSNGFKNHLVHRMDYVVSKVVNVRPSRLSRF